MDQPPSVRYSEICVPLPNSTQTSTAPRENEQGRVQQDELAGCGGFLFRSLMSDIFDMNRRRRLPYDLVEADYHLILCCMQDGIWQAAHEGHHCEAEYSDADQPSRNTVQLWSARLRNWRLHVERACRLWGNYFSSPADDADSIFSPLNLILWHCSALQLHAPFRLLQGQSCCVHCGSAFGIQLQRYRTFLRAWAASSHARTAIWNAAQICRVVERGSGDQTSSRTVLPDPLAVPGILRSAVVTCSYAIRIRSCPTCTRSPPIDLVDLFDADEDELVDWIEQGEGLALWCPLSMPICQCNLLPLATWFCEILAGDDRAQSEFVTFINRLNEGDARSPQISGVGALG